MSNENIFSLAYTPTQIMVTCKVCGESEGYGYDAGSKFMERQFKKFRKEHESTHEVYYDPGKVQKVRVAKK